MIAGHAQLPTDGRRARIRTLVAVLAITMGGALLRFFRLDQPCLWGDEALVFWRTCGTYGQLLDHLRTDGFPPLHYSLYWVLGRCCKMTPWVMRFVPALSGTLTVPAIYFLARQLVNRATSLVAAAFTACSAFMLFYSRDAKMYADAWLFVTLNVGCLLWWFRTGTATAWLCWVAAGCAAVGLQPGSPIPVAVSLLFLLTLRTLRWQRGVLWVLGAALIMAGPLGYYRYFNQWVDRVEDQGWQTSGLTWVQWYNFGRTGPQMADVAASSFLIGWEGRRTLEGPSVTPERTDGPELAVEVIAVVLLLGALPWRRRQSSLDAAPQPPWRVLLWLSLWIVLPAYAFYCRSMPGFAGPAEWGRTLRSSMGIDPAGAVAGVDWLGIGLVLALVYAAVVGLSVRGSRPATARAVRTVVVLAVVLGCCQVMYLVMGPAARAAELAHRPWESVWVPRYLGFVWPAVAVGVAALQMRLPTRAVRTAAVGFLLGVNLAAAAVRVFGQTEPPVDRMAADAYAGQQPDRQTLTWFDLANGGGNPATGNLFSDSGRYYFQLLANQPMSPDLFKLSLNNYRWLRGSPERALPPLLAREPRVQRVVVWTQQQPFGALPGLDPLSRLTGWRLVGEESYRVRDSWTWRDASRYCRREFARAIK